MTSLTVIISQRVSLVKVSTYYHVCNLIFKGDDAAVSMLYQKKVYVRRVAITGNNLVDVEVSTRF